MLVLVLMLDGSGKVDVLYSSISIAPLICNILYYSVLEADKAYSTVTMSASDIVHDIKPEDRTASPTTSMGSHIHLYHAPTIPDISLPHTILT